MSLESNNGTQYYKISCGIASTTTNLSSNNSSGYYRISADEYILWGQSTQYSPVTANNGSQYYFLRCSVPSTTTNLSSNNSTGYYYSSAFNCVSFCDDVNIYYNSLSGLSANNSTVMNALKINPA